MLIVGSAVSKTGVNAGTCKLNGANYTVGLKRSRVFRQIPQKNHRMWQRHYTSMTAEKGGCASFLGIGSDRCRTAVFGHVWRSMMVRASPLAGT
jgi:hypothetical protein